MFAYYAKWIPNFSDQIQPLVNATPWRLELASFSYTICAELKPQFYRPTTGTLIWSTQPMERLSIYFKGPLPTTSRNAYILTVVDEYSLSLLHFHAKTCTHQL